MTPRTILTETRTYNLVPILGIAMPTVFLHISDTTQNGTIACYIEGSPADDFMELMETQTARYIIEEVDRVLDRYPQGWHPSAHSTPTRKELTLSDWNDLDAETQYNLIHGPGSACG